MAVHGVFAPLRLLHKTSEILIDDVYGDLNVAVENVARQMVGCRGGHGGRVHSQMNSGLKMGIWVILAEMQRGAGFYGERVHANSYSYRYPSENIISTNKHDELACCD